MKKRILRIPFYKWQVFSVIAESQNDCDEVIKVMKSLDAPEDSIANIKECFERNCHDGAIMLYDEGKLNMLMIVFPHSTKKELVGTIIHECRHATDKVIESTHLEGMEAAAYLNEWIASQLIKDYI